MKPEKGVALTESLIASAVFILAMLSPLPGSSSNQSLAEALAESLRAEYQAWHFANTLPEAE